MTAVAPATPATRARWTFDDVFDRPGSIRSMAVLRIALGPTVIAHLGPFLANSLRGITYDDRFNEPWWGFLAGIPGWVQVLAIWVAAAAAIPFALGWRTRLVGWITTIGVAANFFLSQHHFRHNRAFLLFLLVTVCLSDSGRVLSLDARRRRADGHAVDDRTTVWPMFLLRALASSVYFASGLSKLIDPDWAGGLVLWDRAVRHQQLVRDAVPGWLADPVVAVSTERWVHAITSPVAVAIELFLAVGLWVARTRIAALWVAIFFHLSIEITASVEVFSLAAIVALVIWVTPSTRDRVVIVDDGTWIRRLDWLARFHVQEEAGADLRVIDRDGTVHTGDRARWLVGTRLPVTFFVVAPIRRWPRAPRSAVTA